MNYFVDIQNECHEKIPVSHDVLNQWVNTALNSQLKKAELTLRFVEPEEMINLNFTYRQQNKVTNVLAFPATYPTHIKLDHPFIGDVVICPSVLCEESQALKINLEAHWAHIVIHGILHLLGYDHITDEEAVVMQQIEILCLNKLGFNNPYQTEEDSFD